MRKGEEEWKVDEKEGIKVKKSKREDEEKTGKDWQKNGVREEGVKNVRQEHGRGEQ